MTSENKEFDDFYAGRMSREEEEKFIDKYGNKVNSFEINNNFDEIYATNDPKLTHREIAKKLCAKLMLRFELKNGTIGTQVSIIEKAFMQLANEALEEAEKCTYKIRDEWLEEYKSVRADIILGKCFGAEEIAIKIRELKKEQVKS